MDAPKRREEPAATRPQPLWPRPRRGEWLWIGGITLLAALLRFWRLTDLPPGLHVDEAFNLLDAAAVAGGWRPIFLPANAGREVLYTYLQAPWVGLLGTSAIGAGRAVSAAIGILTVPALWATVRLIAPAPATNRVRRVALLSAAVLALSYWHLHFSRFGIRAILLPLVLCGVVAAWWAALEAGSPRARAAAAVCCGALLGLAFYSHPAGRALLVLPAAHAAWLGLRDRSWAPLRPLGLAAGTMLVVATPLLIYWARHPELFTGHASEVLVVGEGGGALAANLAKVAGAFHVAGDPARWRNLPGRPAFDPLLGLAMLLGIGLGLRALMRGASWPALAGLWLLALLAPSVLTDAAPNFSRAIGALPAACLFAAVGMDGAAAWLEARGGRRAGAVLVGGVLVIALLWTSYDYFLRWAEHPETPIAFDRDLRDLGRLAAALDELGEPVYLAPETAAHPTVRVAAGRELPGVDTRAGLLLRIPPDSGLPRTGAEGEMAALERHWMESHAMAEGLYLRVPRLPWEAPYGEALEARLGLPWDPEDPGRLHGLGAEGVRLPDVATAVGLSPPPGVELLRARRLDLEKEAVPLSDGPLPPAGYRSRWPLATFEDRLSLYGIEIDGELRAGEAVTLTLDWVQRLPPADPGEALVTAIHLMEKDGHGIADADGPPLGGHPRTGLWREGEQARAEHVLLVPADAPSGPATIAVGWYAREADGSLRPLRDERGREMAPVAEVQILR